MPRKLRLKHDLQRVKSKNKFTNAISKLDIIVSTFYKNFGISNYENIYNDWTSLEYYFTYDYRVNYDDKEVSKRIKSIFGNISNVIQQKEAKFVDNDVRNGIIVTSNDLEKKLFNKNKEIRLYKFDRSIYMVGPKEELDKINDKLVLKYGIGGDFDPMSYYGPAYVYSEFFGKVFFKMELTKDDLSISLEEYDKNEFNDRYINDEYKEELFKGNVDVYENGNDQSVLVGELDIINDIRRALNEIPYPFLFDNKYSFVPIHSSDNDTLKKKLGNTHSITFNYTNKRVPDDIDEVMDFRYPYGGIPSVDKPLIRVPQYSSIQHFEKFDSIRLFELALVKYLDKFSYSTLFIDKQHSSGFHHIKTKYETRAVSRKRKLFEEIGENLYITKEFKKELDFFMSKDNRFLATTLSHNFNDKDGHANAIIVDKFSKQVFRFEPHGHDSDYYDQELLDANFEKIVKKFFPNFSYIPTIDYQNFDGPQYVQRQQTKYKLVEDKFMGNKRIVELDGYCLTWSLLFIAITFMNERNFEDPLQILSYLHDRPNNLAKLLRKFMAKMVYLTSNYLI